MEYTSPSLEEPPVNTNSLPARLLNVFAVPGEVFEEVKVRPVQHLNWLVPALLAILVGWVGAWIIFKQPAIEQQLREISTSSIEQQVQKGKMSEQQAEQVREAAEKFGPIGQKVTAYAAPVFAAFISPFFWGFVLWIFGNKLFKSSFGFLKGVEVAGLANMIGVLDGIVRVMLIVAMGNIFAAPSPMLLIPNFDPQNPAHSLASAANLLTLWVLSVRAIGLARLTGRSFSVAAACVFGVWAAYTLFFWGLAFGVRAAFGG